MTIASLSRTIAASLVRPRHLGRCAALIALAAPAAAGVVALEDPFATLITAERNFAADAIRVGITPAFRAHAAADSVLIRPDPAPALEVLAREVDDPAVTLEWEPTLAAIARSNDLGFTTGPYRMTVRKRVLRGRFLTIWQRDGEGRWRWYLDHGLPPAAEGPPMPLAAAIVRLPAGVAPEKRRLYGTALTGAEDALNLAVLARGTAAFADVLSADGQLFRLGQAAATRADASKVAAVPTGFVAAERLGLRISGDQDLAATYGRFLRGEGQRPVYYVRIWRRERDGWRLLIDQLA